MLPHQLGHGSWPEARSDLGDTSLSKPLRVLLVDDDADATTAIESEFGRNGVSVIVATNLADARVLLRHRPVDVVLLEIRLPDGRGESLLPDIEACSRQPALIITSAFLPGLQSCALEYRPLALSKPVDAHSLLRMVRTVARGYAQPAMERFIKRFNLTNLEAEAIRFVARGLKAKEIADRMHCSEKTIYAHLARACKKTGCNDYHEVVALILAFTCHALGHTPPEHAAFVDSVDDS